MSNGLMNHFSRVEDILAIEPEELGLVILQLFPAHQQHDKVTVGCYLTRVFPLNGSHQFSVGLRSELELAITEAFACLRREGLFVRAPGQPSDWHALTRRGRGLRIEGQLRAFASARVLPVDLLQPSLRSKVWPLYLRGDHDVAVFQAFKEVEVAVRNAANRKGAGFGDDELGVSLMRKAFHAENGVLANPNLVPAEREAEAHLFAGAIGHGKNPVSHREVRLTPEESARLITFASHLLSIVEQR